LKGQRIPEFPRVTGTNLNKQKFNLPDDFEGELNLVLVAFQRGQQLMVNTWLPTADLLENIHRNLRYYELPTISRMNPVARWFINSGMRSGIKDLKSRQETITIYLDKKPFRKALDIPDKENIHIFLVDKKGQVVWRSEGPCNVEKAERLSDFVESYFKK
jgi:hypothetical protein